MDPQDRAEVVPLKRDRVANSEATETGNTEDPKVTVEWSLADHDPAVYRRLLELLFLPRQQQDQRDAA